MKINGKQPVLIRKALMASFHRSLNTSKTLPKRPLENQKKKADGNSSVA